jgi:hypothetical protein
MNCIFTTHARLRMRLRQVTEEMVATTIGHPDRQGSGYRNRLLAFKRFEEGVLKVVYKLQGDRPFIVTVIWE